MKLSIQQRLSRAFVGLALMPLLLGGIFVSLLSFYLQTQQAIQFQEKVAEHTALTVETFFARLEDELLLTAKTININKLSSQEQQNILYRLLSYQDVFEELILLNSEGQEIHHVSRLQVYTETDLHSHAKDEFFVEPTTNLETYYSPVRFSNVTGEPMMTIAIPIVDSRTGLVAGVLAANTRISEVRHSISSLESIDEGNAYIVNAQELIIAHQDQSVVLRGTTFTVPDEVGFQPGLNNEQVVLAFHPIQLGNQKWNVVTEVPWFKALFLTIYTILITGILLAFFLVISALTAFSSVRQIVNPIQTLAKAVQDITGGNLTRRVEVSRQDELGILATAFNTMTARLQQTLAELEQKVMERTAELTTANTQLQQEIRERSRAEDELRIAHQQLLSLTQLKDEFFANASHELRTPLANIKLYHGLLTAQPKKQDKYLATLQRETDRLEHIIEEVLYLSSLDMKQIVPKLQSVDLNRLVDTFVNDHTLLASQKDLTLDFTSNLECLEVQVDPVLLERALGVLISNAFSYTLPGGRVEIHVSNQCTAEECWVNLSITDTGLGVPIDEQQHVFDRFFRGKAAREQYISGTGLGLSIAKEIIDRHNGCIDINSDGEGQGTTFTIRIPTHDDHSTDLKISF